MIKRNIISIALVFLLAACTTETQRIEKVAYNYSYAVANYDVDGAEKYATTETRNTTLIQARFYTKAINPEYIKSDTPATIEITQVEITDDTSAYAIYHKVTPIKNFSDTLWLKKRNGQWKAHAPIPVVEIKDGTLPSNS
jgi:hypothetical protein